MSQLQTVRCEFCGEKYRPSTHSSRPFTKADHDAVVEELAQRRGEADRLKTAHAAAYAALVTERDEAVALLREMDAAPLLLRCTYELPGPCSIYVPAERYCLACRVREFIRSLAPAPGAVDDGAKETTCGRCGGKCALRPCPGDYDRPAWYCEPCNHFQAPYDGPKGSP